MMKAIKPRSSRPIRRQHIRIVCFMTDGYVGNETEIIAEVQKHPNARVFSFGIGRFGQSLSAGQNGAKKDAAKSNTFRLKDDGSKAARKFYERVRTPLLTDISIDWNGLPVADVYPKRIGDLFSAKPVILHGRYTKAASGTIKLKAKSAGRSTCGKFRSIFPKANMKMTFWRRSGREQEIDELTNDSLKYDSAGQNKTRR